MLQREGLNLDLHHPGIEIELLEPVPLERGLKLDGLGIAKRDAARQSATAGSDLPLGAMWSQSRHKCGFRIKSHI